MEQKIFFPNTHGDKLCAILNSSDQADAPCIILAHGSHSHKNRTTYTSLRDALAKKSIATFRFDFYGHEESEGEYKNLTISGAVDDVLRAIAFVKDKGYKTIGLFGSSFGGMATIMAASRSSDIAVVTLKSPVSDYKEVLRMEISDENIKTWQKKGVWEFEDDGVRYLRDFAFYEDLGNNDVYKAAENITVPTLIVHGNADEIVPFQQSVRLSHCLKNGRLLPIHGADHTYTSQKHFDRMIKATTSFIASNLFSRRENHGFSRG